MRNEVENLKEDYSEVANFAEAGNIHQTLVRTGIVEPGEDYIYSSASQYNNKANKVNLSEK